MAMLRDTSCVKTLLLNVTTGKGKKKKNGPHLLCKKCLPWSSSTKRKVRKVQIPETPWQSPAVSSCDNDTATSQIKVLRQLVSCLSQAN